MNGNFGDAWDDIMNVKCKNCGKNFELFITEFCCKECAEEYFMRP